MTKTNTAVLLALLGAAALAAACRHPADYDGVRQRAGAAQQSLDQESANPQYTNPGDSQ